MDNQSNQEQPQATEEAMPINTMDQLAFLIASWFEGNRAQLDHLLEVPDGTSISVQLSEDGPQEELVLTGDVLKGFRAGMIVAASIFDALPFAADVTEVSNDDPAPQG